LPCLAQFVTRVRCIGKLGPQWGDALNKVESIRHEPKGEAAALAPVQDYLTELHARVSGLTVICYGLRVEQLHELTAEHPNIMITILSNLTREFSERLRHANEEIGVLE